MAEVGEMEGLVKELAEQRTRILPYFGAAAHSPVSTLVYMPGRKHILYRAVSCNTSSS